MKIRNLFKQVKEKAKETSKLPKHIRFKVFADFEGDGDQEYHNPWLSLDTLLGKDKTLTRQSVEPSK